MRKKYIVGFLALTFAVNISSAQNSRENVQVAAQNIEQAILKDEIAAALKLLSSDEFQGRDTGTEGIEKAAIFIEDYFEKAGIEPFFKTYRDSFEVKGKTGYNLVGLKRGSDPVLKDEFVVIGAHYDHVGQGEPVGDDVIANGANDNATGTTAVLELAKYFADKDTRRSVLFTLFSAEEMGLVGSKKLAERLKNEDMDVYTMFNIEMIGIPMANKDYLAYLTGFDKSNFAEKFNEYSGQKVLGYLPQAEQYQLFKRSDNYPFYQEMDIPAQTVSTFDFTNYDYYHHVKDEFEHMDVEHMEDLIEALIPGLERMLNSPEREIRLN